MTFGILYEAYSKWDALCDYEHEKGASHWKTRPLVQTYLPHFYMM